jgi:hypothetical protein
MKTFDEIWKKIDDEFSWNWVHDVIGMHGIKFGVAGAEYDPTVNDIKEEAHDLLLKSYEAVVAKEEITKFEYRGLSAEYVRDRDDSVSIHDSAFILSFSIHIESAIAEANESFFENHPYYS